MIDDSEKRPLFLAVRYILSGFDANGQPILVDNAAMVIEDDEVIAIGPEADIEQHWGPAGERFGHHIVVPGFVNAHHHVGMTPLQMGTLDYPLELWIGSGAGRRGLDPYLDTLFSAIEMLRSGVTTVQHIQGSMPGPASHMRNVAGQILKAYQDIGMRASFCFNARDQNRLSHETDDLFAAKLPEGLSAKVQAYVEKRVVDVSDYLGLFDDLRATFHESNHIAIQLAPANLHWCSDEMLLALAQKAAETSVPMHMHLVETPYQAIYAQRRTGRTAVAHLKALGMLGPNMTLGHGVWVTADDMDLVAESGTCICHNCSSNLRLGSGRAPVGEFMRRGVPIALGIDEAGVNDDRDMLQELRMVLYTNRAVGHGAKWPRGGEVLRMATEQGARTTPFGGSIGGLVSGSKADFSIFDWNKVTFPYQDSNVPMLDALVQRARQESIVAVYVGGEKVVDNGRITRVDADAVLKEISERLARPRDAAEIEGLKLANDILPHIEASFADYKI